MPPREDRLSRLLAQARALPKVPGVYLMKDAAGIVIYVGKALCLPDRVSSYFIPSADLGFRKDPMLDEVVDFSTIECEGEWEALLAENRLIKDLHPKYNEMLKDGKTFPYLVVTLRDDFPGVYVTREPNAEKYKGARVLGPFTNPGALRESVAHLQKVFRFRTCELEILESDEKNRHFRPCLLHAIKQCTAPCANKISKEAYREDIQRFLRLLESKRSVMLRELREDMQAASKMLDFEKAAVLRDRLHALEKLDDRGSPDDHWQPESESVILDPRKGLESLTRELSAEKPIRCIECVDIAHLQGSETVGSLVCFVDGRPLKSQYRRYRIRGDGTDKNDDFASIREVVWRRYKEAGAGEALYPDLIVIDGGKGQLSSALQVFERMQVKPPLLVSLAKKEELIHVPGREEPLRLSRHHAGLRLVQSCRDEAHRFAQSYHHILRGKKLLGG